MRYPILVLAVSAAACSADKADVREYVADRAAHQQVYDAVWKGSWQDAAKLDHAWVAEYRPRLLRIVGPLEMRGLTDSVTTLVGAMTGPYDNTTAPDGLLYRTTDSIEVFVSDTAIFLGWVGPGQSKLIDELRRPHQLGAMFVAQAGARRCADLPVRSAKKQVISAMLVEYSQDPYPQCQPNAVVVSVVVGHRVLAAQRLIPDSVASDPRRAAELAQEMIDRLPDR